jgi:CelD/BcsL family acetyltransferase involved in cellulose biosynthesis
MLVDLFARVRNDMGPAEVVFLESVAEGTALFDLLTSPTGKVGGFHAMLNGNLYRHRLARVPDSFDGYLKLLGAKTRADLRTNRKRFLAHVQQDCRTQCFRSAAEIPAFLADAMAISRKTWQYRQMSAGLRDQEELERWYLRACDLGWFRSYVLYAKGAPVAFQVGYVHGDRFHAHEIGYDPEWAQHHVGIFLHTEIMTDLVASGGAIREFDFGNSDNLHKERLSTGSRVEGYFYLIPDDVRGSLMVRSMRATQAVSSRAGAVLGRLGVRKKTRDFLRRLGAAK